MKLSDVQKILNEYFINNNKTTTLRQFSNILALIYPIYIILSRFDFLHFITNVVGTISIILYIAYLLGLVMCFAKNDMLTITIVMALKTLSEIIDLFVFPIGINAIISILIYAFFTIVVFKYYKNNYEL